MRPQRRQPTRLPCPWDSPGKNTGVGCHFLLHCVKVKSEVAQSRPTLSDLMDCSLPGSWVHGIFQARVLEWVAISKFPLKIKLPHDPANSLLIIYLKKIETLIGRDTCTPMLTAALFTITNFWKQAECSPTDEWITKMWYKYTMGYLRMKSCHLQQLLNEMSDKDKYHVISFICRN